VCIFDNDKDDGLLVVQEAAAEAMASAVYDGPEACIRVGTLCHGVQLLNPEYLGHATRSHKESRNVASFSHLPQACEDRSFLQIHILPWISNSSRLGHQI
jgi:hypothetical protein